MKKVVITIVALMCNQAFALTPLGPPTSNVKQGDLLLGFDYSHSEFDVKWSGYGYKGTLKGVESDLYLGKVGLGLSDGFELFGRFGLSEIEDWGNEFVWGVGTKITLGQKDNLSWGALFQLTALKADTTANIDGYMLNGDFDVYEYQFAVGPTLKVGQLSVYGGPFLHFIDGDLDLEFLGSTASYDIKQESEFGGYAGISWNFAKNTNFNVEYQYTGNADAIVVGLVHRFGGPSKPRKRFVIERLTPKPKPKPKRTFFDASGREIISWRIDASRKDAEGNFIQTPVYKDEQKK